MEFDPKNKLQIGTKVYISNIPNWAKFNDGIQVGDVGTIVQNKIFEYTYVVKMDKDIENKLQPVYASEIELYHDIDNYTIPNWDRLSIL